MLAGVCSGRFGYKIMQYIEKDTGVCSRRIVERRCRDTSTCTWSFTPELGVVFKVHGIPDVMTPDDSTDENLNLLDAGHGLSIPQELGCMQSTFLDVLKKKCARGKN